MPARPIAGTVLVNIGDLMMRWTADKLISTVSRKISLIKKNWQNNETSPSLCVPGLILCSSANKAYCIFLIKRRALNKRCVSKLYLKINPLNNYKRFNTYKAVKHNE